MDITDISPTRDIFSVSRLNREVRFLLEGSFPALWIEGEISNFVVPNSGHWYFSLKDANALVRCVMFKLQNRRLTFVPKEGTHVLIRARVSLYEGRGDFQLLVEQLEDAGIGKLQREFEAIKKRLSEAGLFEIAHKKKLPVRPNSIGVITSPTGAAIQDILHVLKRRFASVPVIIYPTLVQGSLAAADIVRAIQTANRRKECDVLLLARGGGSIEDLWAFNEESVAYAIYHSKVPIITGIGHEIDVTIADFVADLRAPTPSVAAEHATPHVDELLASLEQSQKNFTHIFKNQCQHLQQHLLWLIKSLQRQHPRRRLTEQSQLLDRYEITLARLQLKLIHKQQEKLQTLNAQLRGVTPRHYVRELLHQLKSQHQHLYNKAMECILNKQQTFVNLATKLDTLSPLSTLKRGYSIATLEKDNTLLRSIKQIHGGERVNLQLIDGRLKCSMDGPGFVDGLMGE